MFIIDDLLISPFKGLLWVMRKVHQAAKEEIDSQGDRARAELSDLYMQLDTGRITEEEFDARERELLDKLDKIKKAQAQEAERAAALAQQGQGPEGR